MLAVIGKSIPATDILLQFQQLALNGQVVPDAASPGHHDGWGIVSIRDHIKVEGKSPDDASESVEFQKCAKDLGNNFSGILFAHLRKASRGRINLENTHPFVHNPYVFMHNGTVYFPDQSGSDSKQFFSLLRSHLDSDVPMMYTQTVNALKTQKIGFSSLSSMMATSEGVWAYREFSRNPQYYTIYYLEQPTYIIMCQERIKINGVSGEWQAIPKNTLLSINRASLHPHLSPFSS
jgi:predicted glutamine amidotransferase